MYLIYILSARNSCFLSEKLAALQNRQAVVTGAHGLRIVIYCVDELIAYDMASLFKLDSTGHILLAQRLFLSSTHLLQRFTCKISAAVDPAVLADLEQAVIKPRKHPGVIRPNHVELPKQLSETLKRIVGDHPVKKCCVTVNCSIVI